MAKLIHAASIDFIKGRLASEGVTALTGNKDLYNGGSYKGDALAGIIFTDDGYIIAKGHEYYIGTSTPGSLNEKSGLEINSGTISIRDSNGNKLTKTVTLPIWQAGGGLTIGTNGTVQHANTAIAGATKGATAASSNTISVPKITYDTYGHITAADEFIATLDNVKNTEIANSKTMYLLGQETVTSTSEALSKSTVKVVTDSKGVATLSIPKLEVTNGADGITLVDSTNGNKTLAKYIEDAVDDAKTLAMTFKGTFTPKTTEATAAVPAVANVTLNGDTYKAAGNGYIITGGTNKASIKTGDTVIAKVNADKSVTWNIIPSGDETETFITVSTLDQSSKSYNKASAEVTLGNAALRIVGAVADGNTGLVTGDAVYDAIAGHAGIDLVGTVTTIGLAENSGLLICNTSNGTFGTDALSVTAYLRSKLLSYNLNDNDSALTGGRLYSVLLDKSGYLAVDVPFKYSLITARTSDAVAASATLTNDKSVFINLLDDTTNSQVKRSGIELNVGNGLSITGTAGGKITLSSTVYSASAVQTFKGNTTAPNYLIGTVTINGTTTTFYGHDTNTWRDVLIYKIESQILDNTATSTGTKPLKFSSNFSVNTSDEIDLVWAEVLEDGSVTYSV